MQKADPDRVKQFAVDGVMLEPTELTLPAGSTVQDALDGAGLFYETGDGTLTSLAGLSGTIEGATGRWFYQVNDVYPDVPFNEFELADGDVLIWKLSLDGGPDIGVR
ncbi:MAG: DUF4430 domain-containing protein [Actinomycetes bacterium]|jgi:hypothetical protein|nr:DUF4430 domain-containing protein [Actinomycetes bacterium]